MENSIAFIILCLVLLLVCFLSWLRHLSDQKLSFLTNSLLDLYRESLDLKQGYIKDLESWKETSQKLQETREKQIETLNSTISLLKKPEDK